MTTRRRSTREQRDLLIRLGIEIGERWAWISTDGIVTAEHARWRYDTGGEDLLIPLTDAERSKWAGFGYDALGRVWDMPSADGWYTQWGDDLYVRMRWQRVTFDDSPLYVELTDGAERDAAIRGAHRRHRAKDRKRAWAGLGLLLKFRGRPTGPVKGGEADRWVQRGLEIGYSSAYTEFKAETPPGRGAWDARYQWWYRHVRPRLLQKRR